MAAMFYGCSNLTTLDVSNFNTNIVTSMDAMFFGCTNLTSIDLSSFNTSKVTNMNSMFNGCNRMTELNLMGWDISSVTDMNNILASCSGLTSVNMKNSNANSVNKIINQLPTRTIDSTGLLSIAGVDNASQVDEATANSKYWLISLDKTTVNNINIYEINISELCIGPAEVKQVYLGDILIYENKDVVNDKIVMFNENINTLFILGDGILQYDKQNLSLTISDDMNIVYDEEDLNLIIGGEE
jgi:surface protein